MTPDGRAGIRGCSVRRSDTEAPRFSELHPNHHRNLHLHNHCDTYQNSDRTRTPRSLSLAREDLQYDFHNATL